ncbi:MAG: antibiotic biosynthesis monooxygenase [Sedimentisphaerales bacterium]|nr:antibiotic biosynthesis monooxygenase [Sedimentisphaerales bacterium]
MSEKHLTVAARIKAKPGKEQQTKDALLALIEPTHKEAACIDYILHQGAEDKSLFLFYENWTSKEALDEHLQTPHLQAFVAKAGDLLAEPLDVTLWEKVAG